MSYKVLNGILIIIGCALSAESYAACKAGANFTPVDIRMDVGRVVVRPSDPIGTILRKSSFRITPNNSYISCDRAGGQIQAVLSQNNPVLSPAGGASVYNTNIKGIGIRLYREASGASNFSGYYPYSRPLEGGTWFYDRNYTLGEGFFVVEIIKTAASTGSGALTAGRYSSYHSRDDVSKPFLTSTVYGDAITIASSSCELLGGDKTVELPTVSKSGFKGIGSTQGTQAFDLNFLCNGGENLTDYVQSNKISLNFDYTLAPNTTNVLANNAPASTRAKGVGVQLKTNYKNVSKVIAKNEKLELGTVQSNQNIQYNVPLDASYYQTDAIVTPGKVSSVATVTIEYE